jgi:hypothetical protein
MRRARKGKESQKRISNIELRTQNFEVEKITFDIHNSLFEIHNSQINALCRGAMRRAQEVKI